MKFKLTLIVGFIAFSCSNKETNTTSIPVGSNLNISKAKIESDSIVSKREFNESRNDSLIEVENLYLEKLKEIFKDSSGVLVGRFDNLEIGDLAHLSIIDSNELSLSVCALSNLNLSEKEWEKLESGKYKNRKVQIYWEKRMVKIPALNDSEEMEVATKIIFE